VDFDTGGFGPWWKWQLGIAALMLLNGILGIRSGDRWLTVSLLVLGAVLAVQAIRRRNADRSH
jgi:hypothetical protein